MNKLTLEFNEEGVVLDGDVSPLELLMSIEALITYVTENMEVDRQELLDNFKETTTTENK